MTTKIKLRIQNLGTSWNRLLLGITMAGILQMGQNLRATEFKEDFSNIADQTELKNVEGWSLHYGTEGQAKVELPAGFSGKGVRIKQTEQYRCAIPENQSLILKEGDTGEFRIKCRIMAPSDAYAIIQILIAYNDGVHGLAVRFDGGTKDGSADNFIRISGGGESWGKISFTDIKTAAWEKETWYEIILSNLGKAPESTRVLGKVTIRSANDPAKVLVDGAPIASIGAFGAFPAINTVIFGVSGPAKMTDFDDISLTSAKN